MLSSDYLDSLRDGATLPDVPGSRGRTSRTTPHTGFTTRVKRPRPWAARWWKITGGPADGAVRTGGQTAGKQPEKRW